MNWIATVAAFSLFFTSCKTQNKPIVVPSVAATPAIATVLGAIPDIVAAGSNTVLGKGGSSEPDSRSIFGIWEKVGKSSESWMDHWDFAGASFTDPGSVLLPLNNHSCACTFKISGKGESGTITIQNCALLKDGVSRIQAHAFCQSLNKAMNYKRSSKGMVFCYGSRETKDCADYQ